MRSRVLTPSLPLCSESWRWGPWIPPTLPTPASSSRRSSSSATSWDLSWAAGQSNANSPWKYVRRVFHSCTVAVDEYGVNFVWNVPVWKSVLPLFRCLTSIERSVEQCQISVSSPLPDRVMIQFFCRHGDVFLPWTLQYTQSTPGGSVPQLSLLVLFGVFLSSFFFFFQASLKPITCVSRKARPCRRCLPPTSAPTCWSVLPG